MAFLKPVFLNQENAEPGCCWGEGDRAHQMAFLILTDILKLKQTKPVKPCI